MNFFHMAKICGGKYYFMWRISPLGVGTKTRCAARRGEAWKFVSWTPFSSNRDLALVTSTRHSVPPLRRETERQTGRRGESTSSQAATWKDVTQWRQEPPRGGVGKTLVKCMDIKILYAVLPRESTLRCGSEWCCSDCTWKQIGKYHSI